MESVQVIEFGMEYPVVNLELKKNEKDFDRAIIALYVAELERGFIVKRINKTTKKGTKVTYKSCENSEEAYRYIKNINNLIDEFEEKYNTNLGFKLGSQ